MISILAKTSLAAIAALAATSTVFAAEGMYIGAGLGPGETRMKTLIQSENGSTAADTSETKSNIAYKVFGGYRFTPYFGTELQFTRLGKYEKLSESATRDALSLSAVGYVPLTNNIDLLGKAGVVRTFNRTSNSDYAKIIGKGQNGLLLGLGMEYKLTSQLALRVEVERMFLEKHTVAAMNTKANAQTKFTDTQASVGMRYTF